MIAALYRRVKNVLQGKPSTKRSPQWETVRKKHIVEEAVCQSCGRTEKLEVHHIMPFHLYPVKELDDSNLITLCEVDTECHFNVGHHRNWKSFNPNVRADAVANTNALKSKGMYPSKPGQSNFPKL